MNAILQAQSAYRAQAKTVRTHRGLEYDALARITRRLREAGEPQRGIAALAGAIHDNRRLWTILAADAADRDNPLPAELRARIIYLAEFTRLHSAKVLRATAEITPLIDINTAVMRGLHDRGARA